MTRLILVRHGHSVVQEEGILSGHSTCRGLTEIGRRQVEALRDRLARTGEVQADVVLSSVLRRAVETAEILLPAVGGTEVIEDCDLCEIHPGDAEGMTWLEYEERYGRAGATPVDAPPVAGMEPIADFIVRINARLDRITSDHPGATVLAAVHGGVIEASLKAFFDLPVAPPSSHLANATLVEWEHAPSRWTSSDVLSWSLVRWNDHAHLAGTELISAC